MVDLVAAVHRALREEQKVDDWGGDVIHMSDLAVAITEPGDKKCSRQFWLRLKGEEKTPPGIGQMMMFDNGHGIHERLVAKLKKGLPEGWTVAAVEGETGAKLGIKGHFDVKLRGPKGQVVIVDFKTTRSNAFKFEDGLPKLANVYQIQGYGYEENADAMILLYVDRDGSNTPIQKVIERDDERVLASAEYIKKVAASPVPPEKMLPVINIKENKGPNSVVASLPWQCKYCDFYGISCSGPMLKDDSGKVVGHINGGTFTPREGFEYLQDTIREVLGIKAPSINELATW